MSWSIVQHWDQMLGIQYYEKIFELGVQALCLISFVPHHKGVMTYKILQGLCPEILLIKLIKVSQISEYETRIYRDLQISKVKLEYARQSLFFPGVKNWNEIPDGIREKKSIFCFNAGFSGYFLSLKDSNTIPW